MTIYIEQIKSISHDNKYTKWYVNIVENALQRASSKKAANKILGYSEKHHIVPESFYINRKRKGPKGFLKGEPENKENFVYLSAKEHFIVHMLLSKMMINEGLKIKMFYALNLMVNTNEKINITAKLYEKMKQNFLDNHNMKNEESKEKIKETNLERYGYEHTLQVPEIREKGRKTKLEKYGDEQYRNIEKTKQTWIEKYGVDNPQKCETIKEKTKQTNLDNHGVEYTLQLQEVREKGNVTKEIKYGDKNYNNREKAKQTLIEKYGVESPTQTEEVQQKYKDTCIDRYGVDNYSKTPEFKQFMSVKSKEIQKNTPIFVCPKCGKQIKGKGNLNQHLRANKCHIEPMC